MACEIGIERDKKTTVTFFYRECAFGVSGLSDFSWFQHLEEKTVWWLCWLNWMFFLNKIPADSFVEALVESDSSDRYQTFYFMQYNKLNVVKKYKCGNK